MFIELRMCVQCIYTLNMSNDICNLTCFRYVLFLLMYVCISKEVHKIVISVIEFAVIS